MAGRRHARGYAARQGRRRLAVEPLEQRRLLAVTIAALKEDLLLVDVGGDGAANPGDVLQYDVTVANHGDMDATKAVFSDLLDPNTTLVPGSVNVSPLAFNDHYTAVGNTYLEVGGEPSGNAAVVLPGQSLFDNDVEFLGDTFSLASFEDVTVQNGRVQVAADGSFAYRPPVGFTGGDDSFTYTLVDSRGLTGTATVTITVDGLVWYVDNTAVAGGDGRAGSPLNSLAPLDGGPAADGPGDVIFLYKGAGETSPGIKLEDQQQLIGQGVDLVVNGHTLVAGDPTARPMIASSGRDGISLAADNTVRGLNAMADGGTGIAGVSVGQLTIADVDLMTAGAPAVDLAGGILDVTLGEVVVVGGLAGIRLVDTTGSFTVTGTGTLGLGASIANTTAGVMLDNVENVELNDVSIADTMTGVLLNNVKNVELNGVSIDGTTADGILGVNVHNFTFRDGEIINFGDDSATPSRTDNGMEFVGLTGDVLVQRATIGPDANYVSTPSPPGVENDGIRVVNTDDNPLNLTVTGTTFVNVSNDGIDVRGQDSDVTLIVDGGTNDGPNNFSGLNGRAITVDDALDAADNSHFVIDVRHNLFADVGIGARWAASGGTTIHARFNNNTMAGTTSDAVRALGNDGSESVNSTVHSTIADNDFGGGSMLIAARRGSTHTILVDGNSNGGVVTTESSRGGTLNLSLLDNTLLADALAPDFPLATLVVQASTPGTAATTNAHIEGNTITMLNDFGLPIFFDQAGSNTIALQGPSTAGNSAATTWLKANNTLVPNNLFISGTIGAPVTVPLPEFPLPAAAAAHSTGTVAADPDDGPRADSLAEAPPANDAPPQPHGLEAEALAASDVDVTIGTLPAGKQVVVRFEATIDDPFLGTTNRVANQGTVSGSNFADVPTDDPALPGPTDPTITVIPADFGDAPDPNYPTLAANNGAAHILGDLFLGFRVDADPDGQPNATATGDDTDGIDDENGAKFHTPLVAGQASAMVVALSQKGYVDAWIDFNGDGDWADVGEQIVASKWIVTASTTLSFDVPTWAAGTDRTAARVRLSSVQGLSFNGLAPDGEVEDYMVSIRGSVVGRHVFYNNSAFDDHNPAANADDDLAVAPDKKALLPGQMATFANYTSYARGLNGIMVDMAGLPDGVVPKLDDFQFRVGNDDDPSGWTSPSVKPTVTVRENAGVGGSDRVTIIFPDGALRNTWAEVTVKALNLGLAANDVFYFGNAPAESGNSTDDATVTTTDLLVARNNPRGMISEPAEITFSYDYDRDLHVNATDVLLARNNQTSFLDALNLLDLIGVAKEAQQPAAAGLAWLTGLDQPATQRPTHKDVAVDQLLATYWP